MAERPSTSTPSFARPTAASSARNTPKSPKAQEGTPSFKALKRPLRFLHRPVLPSGLLKIRPANRKEPSPLAKLPPEIRFQIYECILPVGPLSLAYPRRLLWPIILRVCRLIRAEAAYIFYTQIPFMTSINSLNFFPVKLWLTRLPPSHRALLSKNRTIKLSLRIETCFYPSSSTSWLSYGRFGNIYAIQNEQHRRHFINFCRLAEWWLWCANQPGVKEIKWDYGLERSYYWDTSNEPGDMRRWLTENLLAVALPCVQEAWTRERREAEMKDGALGMLEGVDRCFRELMKGKRVREETVRDWEYKVGVLRRFIGKW